MDAFRGDAHKRRFVVAHGAVRLLLAHHLRSSPQATWSLPSATTASRTWPGAAALEFNLTHSGELALIAVAARRARWVSTWKASRAGPSICSPSPAACCPRLSRNGWPGIAEPARAGCLPATVGMQRGRVQGSGRGLHDRLCPHPDRPAPALARAAAGRATPPAADWQSARPRPQRGLCRRVWR